MKSAIHAYFLILVGIILCLSVAMRVPKLGLRPMHADEAVQAFLFRQLWQHGRYRYNPDEFHGPTLVYATYPLVWLSGVRTFADTTKTTYRAVSVLFGTLLVLVIVTVARTFGKSAGIWAALLASVSPALVFYSRYYIHEMLLAVFTMAAVFFLQRYWRRGNVASALGLGVCVGLMQATKETAAISYLAAGLAFAVTGLWWWLSCKSSGKPSEPVPNTPEPNAILFRTHCWHFGVVLFVSIAVASLFLSSFGTNPRGLIDGARTYLPWLRRAGGASPHIHRWYFYLQRLLWWHPAHRWPWSEGMIAVLGSAGLITLAGRGFQPSDPARRWFGRWIGAYTVLLTGMYCAIPYKTPWCLVQFWCGWVLLAGIGAATITQRLHRPVLRWAVGGCLLVGVFGLGVEAYYASYVRVASARNPYVYAQTSFGVEKMTQQVEALAATAPTHFDTHVQVMWHDPYYWPLPWYLRHFDQTEFWQHVPERPAAPIIIASPQFDQTLTRRLGQDYLMTGYYELRPHVLAQLWVRFDLWEAYLKRLGRL